MDEGSRLGCLLVRGRLWNHRTEFALGHTQLSLVERLSLFQRSNDYSGTSEQKDTLGHTQLSTVARLSSLWRELTTRTSLLMASFFPPSTKYDSTCTGGAVCQSRGWSLTPTKKNTFKPHVLIIRRKKLFSLPFQLSFN